MNLEGAIYDCTRNAIHVHGKKYTVKKQRGRFYIHAENHQVTVTKLIRHFTEHQYDIVRDYLLSGLFLEYPCHAVNLWLMKYREMQNITTRIYRRRFIDRKIKTFHLSY